jgi:5-formyltetrahydrofolate cyclo-ligase
MRTRLLTERMTLPPDLHARWSAALAAALAARFPPGSLGLVAGYWPIRGEFDPRPYLLATIAAGGAAALPVVTGPSEPLVFRRWTLETPMATGRWDIEHPAEGEPVTPNALLIPLVGFDGGGHRLGYGGGFYDRTLAVLSPRPRAIGLGFEIGRIADFTARPHDIPMDAIVTEA